MHGVVQAAVVADALDAGPAQPQCFGLAYPQGEADQRAPLRRLPHALSTLVASGRESGSYLVAGSPRGFFTELTGLRAMSRRSSATWNPS